MEFGKFKFGSLKIDGIKYKHDLVIDRGKIRAREKKGSRTFRDQFGHTPVSLKEKIPWRCTRLVVGTGMYGSLPVMRQVKRKARRKRVDILILPTVDAIETLVKKPKNTNAILHVTC